MFISIPKADYDKEVSARGYIKIGGEYFYSEVKTRSFIQVANAVLADDEIDESTKNSIRDLLNA